MKDIAFQAPGLVIAAFIVVKFLNYIKARNGALEKVLTELNRVLRENSKVLGEATQALSQKK